MRLLSKRTLLLLSAGLLLAGCLTTYYCFTVNTSANTNTIIVIDPGHGGNDPGKVGVNQELEKDINLAISQKLAIYLKSKGYSVVLTRNSDKMLADADANNKKTSDMKNRIAIMTNANADLVISIHQNSYPDASVKGAQCFYYSESEDGKQLANTIQTYLTKLVDSENHRQAKQNDSYYILKNSPCPAVIVECGFLSNHQEATLLTDTSYQEKIAFAIFLAILEYS